jgi:hypothetical protein
MKSRTEYVWPHDQIKQQVASYKRFKKLTERWIELAIQHSKLTIEIAKKKDSR